MLQAFVLPFYTILNQVVEFSASSHFWLYKVDSISFDILEKKKNLIQFLYTKQIIDCIYIAYLIA